MEDGQPDNAGEAALRGTMCHHEIPWRGTSDQLTQDENDMVQRARDWLAGLAEVPPGHEWEYESWLPYFEDGSQDLLYFGWADAVLVLEDRVIIAEFKFGWSELDQVFAGAQLTLLRIAAEQVYQLPTEGHLYSARSRETFQSPALDVAEAVATIKRVIYESQAPDAPVTPGPSQCRYCKGLAACQDAEKAVQRVVHDQTALTPETRAKRRVFVALAEDWIERVKKDDWSFLNSGGEIPGYHLQTREGNREIKDPTAAYQALKDVLTQEDFLTAVDARVTKLEGLATTVLLSSGKCKTKKEAQEHFAGLLGSVISRGPASTFIAKDRT